VADAVAALTRLSEARTVVASAVQQRRCTVRQLSAELRERHDARDAMFRRVLAEETAGARSAPEADLQELIAAFSLPVPLFNPSLFLDGKFLACPDAWWPQSAVAVEVDSKQWHLLLEDWVRTMRRHRQMSAAGIRVIHVSPSGGYAVKGGSGRHGNQSGRSLLGARLQLAGRFSRNAATPSAASAIRPVS